MLKIKIKHFKSLLQRIHNQLSLKFLCTILQKVGHLPHNLQNTKSKKILTHLLLFYIFIQTII